MSLLCEYGCENESRFRLKNGKHCCSEKSNSCPAVREKIKISRKGQHAGEKNPNYGKHVTENFHKFVRNKQMENYRIINPICEICGNEIPFDVWKKNIGRKTCSNICRNAANRNSCTSWERDDEFKSKMSEIGKKLWVENRDKMINCLKNRRFSSVGEREVRKKLKEILGDKQVLAHTLFTLSDGTSKSVDMWLPEKNTIIEYDGIYHEKDIFGNLAEIQRKDMLLNELCQNRGIKIIRVRDEDYRNSPEAGIQWILLQLDLK